MFALRSRYRRAPSNKTLHRRVQGWSIYAVFRGVGTSVEIFRACHSTDENGGSFTLLPLEILSLHKELGRQNLTTKRTKLTKKPVTCNRSCDCSQHLQKANFCPFRGCHFQYQCARFLLAANGLPSAISGKFSHVVHQEDRSCPATEFLPDAP